MRRCKPCSGNKLKSTKFIAVLIARENGCARGALQHVLCLSASALDPLKARFGAAEGSGRSEDGQERLRPTELHVRMPSAVF